MSDTKLCPYCGEEVKVGAIKCKHCHSMLEGEQVQSRQQAAATARPLPSQPASTSKPFYKRWWAWALAILLFFIIVGALSGGDDTPAATPEPVINEPAEEAPATSSQDAEAQPEPEPGIATIKAGTHLIGIDIEPGRYRSDGGINYWERLSGLSGELGDIIANGAFSNGSIYIDIKPTDEAFSFNGSGTFYLVDDSYQGLQETSFGDGIYWVGRDIQPGRYRSNTGAQYWARLSGFSGELGNILANDAFGEGSVIVEIRSGDVGFETRGAEWEKID